MVEYALLWKNHPFNYHDLPSYSHHCSRFMLICPCLDMVRHSEPVMLMPRLEPDNTLLGGKVYSAFATMVVVEEIDEF